MKFRSIVLLTTFIATNFTGPSAVCASVRIDETDDLAHKIQNGNEIGESENSLALQGDPTSFMDLNQLVKIGSTIPQIGRALLGSLLAKGFSQIEAKRIAKQILEDVRKEISEELIEDIKEEE